MVAPAPRNQSSQLQPERGIISARYGLRNNGHTTALHLSKVLARILYTMLPKDDNIHDILPVAIRRSHDGDEPPSSLLHNEFVSWPFSPLLAQLNQSLCSDSPKFKPIPSPQFTV
jgi:hypothetical protein